MNKKILVWDFDSRNNRKNLMIEFVTNKLPEFIEMVANEEADVVLLHQDAFAGDYQLEELILLGMAVKYAGLAGKEIRIIGTNRETIGNNLKESEGKNA